MADLCTLHPLDAARAAGVILVDDPAVTSGYVVERDPADPTRPGSAKVLDHRVRVRAGTREGLVAGAVQVVTERVAELPVTAGRHVPDLARRALHIDAGRHYFSLEHLRQLATLAAWCRLNTINLHISETHGYRLASARHPEVVADDHLTFDEVANLREHCASLGIRVIPSFDMPGHLNGVLAAHPWARLRGGDGREYEGALDITSPRARALVWDLLDEVIDVFDADEVTIGGDEFLDFGEGVDVLEVEARRRFGEGAHENDVWIAFLNDTVERLRARGVRAGVWNDGLRTGRVVDLDPGVILHYWTRWGAHMAPPAELARQGYTMTNWDGESLYFVLKHDHLDEVPTFESVSGGFDPRAYPDKVGATRLPDTFGAYFSIWCDEPDALSSAEIVAGVRGPLYAFGSLCWPCGRRRSDRAVRDALARLGDAAIDSTQSLKEGDMQ